MRGSIGWRHVLPLSVALVGLFAAAHYVVAWIIHSEVIRAGERSVGAHVNVADTHVSLVAGRVSLRMICVANPLAPLRNLIEADRCDVELEPASLLHKRTVVRYGAVTGLRFGTSRDTSGALPGHESDDVSPLTGWLDEDAARGAQKWLERLDQRFDRDLVCELESIRLTDELVSRWPGEYAALEDRVRQLRQRTDDFQAKVRQAQQNPLRHVDFLESVPGEIAKIRADTDSLSRDIENLPNIVEADRRAIVAARQHDERLLGDELQFEPIDTNVLSAYLLQKQLSGPLGDLLGSLRWVRRMVPADAKSTPIAADAKHRRGQDVLFAGCRPTPDLLIRSLHLQGTARLGGQPIELVGTLTNVTDKPARHHEPIRLRLTACGSLPLELQATIDRTRPVPRDQLLVDCSGIVLPKLRLGGSKKLRLSLAPTTASLSVSITLEGDKLSGDVQLIQRQVEITPTVSDELARLHLDTELAKTLSDVDWLATRISLGGTLDKPQCAVWSNLGPAVAEALDRALARTTTNYTHELLAESHDRVNERLAELDRQIADAEATLEPQLAASAIALNGLAANELPTHRLSLEHLGRRLPADSLFR